MQKYRDNITIQGRGGLAPVRNANVTVYNNGTNDKAIIYQNVQKTPKANPFQGDALGAIFFYAENGRYDLFIQGDGQELRINDILMEDVWEDVDQLEVDVVAVEGVANNALGIANNAVPKPDLANATDPDKGAGMVGYQAEGSGAIGLTIKTKSEFAPLDAREYGFALSASSNENQQAIYAALAEAKGKPVVVECPNDFEVFQMSLPDEYDVDLTFRGSGRLHRATGGSINIRGEYKGLQAVSAITDGTASVNMVTEALTKIFIADTSEYQIGDYVKIISDDIDPDARTDYTARRGEHTTVVLVESDGVWVPRTLEDQQYYVTNVRLARLSRRRVDVRGLVIQSSLANTNPLFIVTGLSKVRVLSEVYGNHSGTFVQFNSCVDSYARLAGVGAGGYEDNGITNRLGYMFNDANGQGNTLVGSVGSGWRHFCTTSFSSIAADNSNISLYGAPRDLTVLNGYAHGCQNIPFDEHEGARRTKFVNCKSFGSLKGTNSVRCGFQLRGRDSQVINCDVDQSHEYGVSVPNSGRGRHRITGGTYRVSEQLIYAGATPMTRPDVFVDGARVITPVLGVSGFATTQNTNRAEFNNCVFEAPTSVVGTPRLFQALDNSQLHFNNCTAHVTLAAGATGSTVVRVGQSAVAMGDIKLYLGGDTISNLISYASPSGAASDLKFSLMAGAYSAVAQPGIDPALRYTAMDYTQSPPREFTGVDDSIMTANDPINNGSLSFTRVSNTVVTMKAKGSDGVTRSVNFTLA